MEVLWAAELLCKPPAATMSRVCWESQTNDRAGVSLQRVGCRLCEAFQAFMFLYWFCSGQEDVRQETFFKKREDDTQHKGVLEKKQQ